jgi:hypothetical protein
MSSSTSSSINASSSSKGASGSWVSSRQMLGAVKPRAQAKVHHPPQQQQRQLQGLMYNPSWEAAALQAL